MNKNQANNGNENFVRMESDAFEDGMVKTHGSIHRLRKMSGFSFLILRTARRLVQCILEPERCEILGPDGSVWEGPLREEMCIRM